MSTTYTIAKQGRGNALHISTERGNIAACNGGGVRMVSFHAKQTVDAAALADLIEAGRVCGRCVRASHLRVEMLRFVAAQEASPADKRRAKVEEMADGSFRCLCGRPACGSGATRRAARRQHRALEAGQTL